jgi:hypothetical protein
VLGRGRGVLRLGHWAKCAAAGGAVLRSGAPNPAERREGALADYS